MTPDEFTAGIAAAPPVGDAILTGGVNDATGYPYLVAELVRADGKSFTFRLDADEPLTAIDADKLPAVIAACYENLARVVRGETPVPLS